MNVGNGTGKFARQGSRFTVRSGQNAVEYALVIAILAVGCIVSIAFLRDSFRTLTWPTKRR